MSNYTRSLSATDADHLKLSLEASERLSLTCERNESNDSLVYSYAGSGFPISKKWNVKVYSSKKKGIKCVSNDLHLVDLIFSRNWQSLNPSERTVLKIDDSGWGCPLGGVMVGVSDESRVETDIVDIEHFNSPGMQSRNYLQEYARKGVALLDRFNATPQTHRIEICTGFVNVELKDALRNLGYEVSVTEITGLLQDTLEQRFREYLLTLTHGIDLYCDPKEVEKSEIPKFFDRAVAYGKQHPELIKSGWKCFQ